MPPTREQDRRPSRHRSDSQSLLGRALLTAVTLAGCYANLTPTTATVFTPATDDRYKLAARVTTGAFVYALNTDAVVDVTTVIPLKLTGEGSGFFERTSFWEESLARPCLQSFSTSYRVRYWVFPFIPLSKSFFVDTPIGSVVTRTPTTIQIVVPAQPVLVTRTQLFMAIVTDASGCSLTTAVSWSSSNTGTATVINGGVTGVAQGSVTITASIGALSTSVTITVGPAPTLQSIAIQGTDAITMEEGDQVNLTVFGTWSDGIVEDVTPAARGTAYGSSSSGVASVASTGRVTAQNGAGSATITATNGALTDAVQVSVLAPMDYLSITPSPVTMTSATAPVQLTINGVREDGTTQDITATGAGLSLSVFSFANVVHTGFSAADKTRVYYEGRGKARIEAYYNSPTGLVSGSTPVCNDAPTGGNFLSPSLLSPGLRYERLILSDRHDKIRILDNDGDEIESIILDKPAGDEIVVYSAGPNALVVVHTTGGDSVIEYLQGGEYVFQVTPGDGLQDVRIYNTKQTLGEGEDEFDEVITKASFDIHELEPVTVLVSPDNQLAMVMVDRSYRGRSTIIRAFGTFNQERVLNDSSSDRVLAGGAFSTSLTFDTAACTGVLSWRIDNSGTANDDSGTGAISW